MFSAQAYHFWHYFKFYVVSNNLEISHLGEMCLGLNTLASFRSAKWIKHGQSIMLQQYNYVLKYWNLWFIKLYFNVIKQSWLTKSISDGHHEVRKSEIIKILFELCIFGSILLIRYKCAHWSWNCVVK